MKAQFDHSSLATSATATERGRARKRKIPITASKAAAASKQQGCLSLYTPCSISLKPSCFTHSCERVHTLLCMHPCVCMNVIRNGHSVPQCTYICITAKERIFLFGFYRTMMPVESGYLSRVSGHLQPHLYLMSNQNWRVTGTCLLQHWG